MKAVCPVEWFFRSVFFAFGRLFQLPSTI